MKSGPYVKYCLLALACFGLLACGQPPERRDALALEQYPGFLAWVEHAAETAVDEAGRATAERLPDVALALSSLDGDALERVLDEPFIPHDPMLEDGREGLLQMTRENAAPRGGAPNLLAGTAHLLVDGEFALIHRLGRLGPLQSVNFDLLRFTTASRLAEYWSFVQPVEAGFIDNMLFSFVVPRQLDLIPAANSGAMDIWADLPRYATPVRKTAAQVQLNRLLVSDYLDQLYAGVPAEVLLEQFLAADYTLHVGGVAPGREAYREVLSRAKRRENAARRELVLAQNDLVWVLSRVSEIREADVPEIASADLFRVRDGKIVEQWRVVQPSPRFSRNPNGLF